MMPLPEMGPIKELFATLAAATTVVKSWLDIKDSVLAKKRMDEAFDDVLNDPNIEDAVEALKDVIPLEVWEKLLEKIKHCSDHFTEILASDGKYFPQVVDQAVEPYRVCVCRVLATIHKLYGRLPLEAQRTVWNNWDCPALIGESFSNEIS
jgi:hypothetical protein